MTISNDELASIIRQELSESRGGDNDELTAHREQALNYYYCNPRGDEIPGRSRVISPDLSNMTEAVIAQIMPGFSGEVLGEFEPNGEEDEQQATAESAAVNYMLMDRARGFAELVAAIKNCLLMRNGWIKVFVEETENSETFSADEITATQLNELLTEWRQQERTSITRQDIEETGTSPDGDTLFKVSITIVTTTRQFRMYCVANEDMRYNSDLNENNILDARFLAERRLMTRSQLIKMGFPKKTVNDLEPVTTDTDETASIRNRRGFTETQGGKEKSTEIIEVFECYAKIDRDEDSVAELLQVWYVNNAVLQAEPVEVRPYCQGVAIIMPNQLEGIDLYDKLKSIQDIKTQSLRQYLDNMVNMNNRRVIAVKGMVEMDDLTHSKPGGVVRTDDPNAVVPLPVDDIGPSAQALLNYMDQIRSESGGASLDLQSAQAQIVGQTAHGIERQFSSREQLAAFMARTVTETLITSLFLLTHTTLRLYWPETIRFKRAGEWVEQNPVDDWQERDNVNMKAGMSKAERSQRAMTLNQLMQYLQLLMQAGKTGELVDDTGIYNALTDWMRANELPAPNQYIIDPASPQAQQARQSKAQAAEQQQQAVAQQNQQILQLQLQITQLNNMMEKYKHDSELAHKYWADALKSEEEEAKIIGAATLELQRTQLAGKEQAVVQQQEARPDAAAAR